MKNNRQRSTIKILLFVGFISIISFPVDAVAQSSPPLLLDDTGTLGPGNWEINVLASLEHATRNDEWQVPLFDINYGLGDRGQVTVGLPYVVDRDKDSKVHQGIDGMEVGIKYRFMDHSSSSGSSFSCCPKVYYSFEKENKSELLLPVEWHREWSRFGLTAEAGHVWVQSKSEGWEGGLATAVYFKSFDLSAEWHTAVQEAPFDLSEPMVNVGLVWEWSEAISSYFSLGKSLHSHDEETNLWSLVGIQFLL
ncbi:MAG: hypothetical protein WC703_02620 [Candidatus Neomarinimicrobiota bacterium]